MSTLTRASSTVLSSRSTAACPLPTASPTFLHCLVKAKDFQVCRSFVFVGERRPQLAHLRSGGMSHLGRLSGGEADYVCSG